jgi:hypothetical protein
MELIPWNFCHRLQVKQYVVPLRIRAVLLFLIDLQTVISDRDIWYGNCVYDTASAAQ